MRHTIQTLLATLMLLGFLAAPLYATPQSERDEQTADYVLTAAYPNPFNASTSFKLTLKKDQHVTVEVYSALGKRVKSLYDDRMRANETKTFTFDAEGLPTGIYLYQVKGETFRIARQASFLK